MASTRTAERLAALLEPCIRRLLAKGHTPRIVDAGAADGTLLHDLHSLVPDAGRCRWLGIDHQPRPEHLHPSIAWLSADLLDCSLDPHPGAVIAHELLDDVPCDVLEVDDDGQLRTVHVDPNTGRTELGAACDESQVNWCGTWWRTDRPASVVECGLTRDAVWRRMTDWVSDGTAVAIDYGHLAHDRASGNWDGGTVTGYRHGRVVSPVPDGTCNITAHVALDACAAAVPRAVETRLEFDATTGLWWLTQQLAG